MLQCNVIKCGLGIMVTVLFYSSTTIILNSRMNGTIFLLLRLSLTSSSDPTHSFLIPTLVWFLSLLSDVYPLLTDVYPLLTDLSTLDWSLPTLHSSLHTLHLSLHTLDWSLPTRLILTHSCLILYPLFTDSYPF